MLDLYATKGTSVPQKLTIITAELALIGLAYFIMFGAGQAWFVWLFDMPIEPEMGRRWIIFSFSLITLARMLFTMFYLMQRAIPWSETIPVPLAFALYYIGFAILVLPNGAPVGALDFVAIGLFIVGGAINTVSELMRHFFKQNPANKGKLYTGGLFGLSMHINFFGDVLWVLAYAMVAGHSVGYLIPVLLLALFMFFYIPPLDAHLAKRYGQAFCDYADKTKRLIPFVW
ncbi:DUF1295 domain-containing protein [Maritalea porphyrae]|uniref:DUF1295 domain-containing protein n=1 Tax=Maritalea porphyrae TaxID=880732 RepID=UPI0022AEB446|nr:DUF1295 domain-containing protein [Maritalea porphyrae]MCZ4272147.1 DUF1295 domain-containing protein [Maritalea porphyrae]